MSQAAAMLAEEVGFNTASGMDCMQYKNDHYISGQVEFQYRKRYGLHAMTTLSIRRFRQ